MKFFYTKLEQPTLAACHANVITAFSGLLFGLRAKPKTRFLTKAVFQSLIKA